MNFCVLNNKPSQHWRSVFTHTPVKSGFHIGRHQARKVWNTGLALVWNKYSTLVFRSNQIIKKIPATCIQIKNYPFSGRLYAINHFNAIPCIQVAHALAQALQ